MSSIFSIQVPEHFINKLFSNEDLIVFDVTSFSVVTLEQKAKFEDYAILICFVVLVSSDFC